MCASERCFRDLWRKLYSGIESVWWSAPSLEVRPPAPLNPVFHSLRSHTMLAVSPALNNAVEVNTEAFITLSKIAFSSLERLSTLNLNATRLALEEGASGFTSLLQAQDARTQQKLLGATPEKVTNNAAAYLQGVQEIAAETKSEVIQLISSYFSSQGGSSNLSMGHLKGFEVFKDFAQQVIDMTAANTRAAGDSMARISSATAALARKSV
jgi:hypothetical protein